MTATKRLSITRQPPITPELWRDAYARIAAQYAVFLERYDLAEDAQAEDIIRAIEREVRSDLARQVAGLPVPEYDTGETVFVDPDVVSRAAVLAVLAGTDATPEPPKGDEHGTWAEHGMGLRLPEPERCPKDCGCRLFLGPNGENDADVTDCGCDGPCTEAAGETLPRWSFVAETGVLRPGWPETAGQS